MASYHKATIHLMLFHSVLFLRQLLASLSLIIGVECANSSQVSGILPITSYNHVISICLSFCQILMLLWMKILRWDHLYLSGALTWFVGLGSRKTMRSFIMDCLLHCLIISVELEIQCGNQTYL